MARHWWIVVLVLLAAACASDVIDVHDVDEPAEPVPFDARLHDGGWPEAAAWVREANERGMPVVVNIFASWCEPCRREMPLLLEAAESQRDVAFLGIDHLDQRDAGERFVDEMGIEFATIYDVAGGVAAAVHARGMPTTVAFDRDGRMVAHHTGELTRSSLEELLDAVR